MADFNPDAYLAEKKAAPAFDPDAYLASKGGKAASPKEGTATDLVKSIVQGLADNYNSFAGVPGDISDLVRSGMKGVGVPTRDPSQPLMVPKQDGSAPTDYVTLPGGDLGFGANPNSQSVLPGKDYEPQTRTGRNARLGVDIAPIILGAPSLLKLGVAGVKGGAKLVGSVPSKIASALQKYDTAAAPITQEIKAGVNSGDAAARAVQEAQQAAAAKAAAEADAAKRSRIAKALQIVGKNTQPDVSVIGTVRNPSEIGSPLQTAALQNEATLTNARSALDKELRTARDAIVAENEAKGVTITSTPAYKALVERLKPIVSPNVATMPEIAQSTDPTVKRLYQEIWDRVTPQRISLTPEQYRQAERAGVKVKIGVGPNGEETYSRTIMPSFNAVDDTRRFLGQAFADQQSGYSAISGVEKQKLYSMLDDIQKEYVGGAQGALQKNWREASERLNMFDTKAGKTLTATQGDTGALRTNAADIPSQFFGKGADRIGHLQDVTGNPALVQRGAGDWVASQLAGKTGPQVAEALSPQRKLADMLAHPTVAPVASNVSSYAKALNAWERTGARAASEGKAAEQAQKTASAVGTQAESAQATARAAEDAAHARAAKYDRLSPREVVSSAKTDIANDLKAGRITKAQHDDIYRKIDEADVLHGKTDKIRSTIKKIIIGGAIVGAPATIAKTAHLGGL